MCQLHIWDIVAGRKLHDRPGDFYVGSRAVSKDGRYLASEEVGPETIGLWDLSNGRLLRRLSMPGYEHPDLDIKFSNDGRHLVGARPGE